MPPPEIVPIRAENAAGKFPLPKFNKKQANQVFGGVVDQVRTAARNPDRILNSPSNLGSGLSPDQKTELADLIKNDGQEIVSLLDEQQTDLDAADRLFGAAEAAHQSAQGKFITPDQASSNEGLIIDSAGNFTGEFSEKTAVGFKTKSIAAEVTPSIQGLRRLKEEKSPEAAKEEKNPEAAKLYQELSDSDSVRVTYKTTANGAEESVTLTLAEFDPKLEAAAAQEWMAKHPEISYEDAKKKFPEAAHAYRIKAEQAMNTQYTLHHKQDAPVEETNPADPKLKTEANKDKPETRALDASNKTLKTAFEGILKRLRIEKISPDQVDKDLADVHFLNDRLARVLSQKIKGNAQVLSALATSATRRVLSSHPNLEGLPSEVQTLLTLNETAYQGGKDPAHDALARQIRTLPETTLPAKEVEALLPQMRSERMYPFMASLQKAIVTDLKPQGHENPSQETLKAITRAVASGFLNEAEGKILNSMHGERGQGLQVLEGVSWQCIEDLGLSEFYDKGFIQGAKEKIPILNRFLKGPEDINALMLKNLDDNLNRLGVEPKDKKEKSAIARSITFSEADIALFKKKGDIGGYLMGLILSLQVIQGVLEEGVTKDSGGGAPPS